jgi:nucleotide-binding universal stress UspA family protein
MKKITGALEKLRLSIEKEGIPCETHVLVRGLTTGEDIVDFAKEHDIDEIVIGIEKTSKVGKLLFGSTAQMIILEATCPVISIK